MICWRFGQILCAGVQTRGLIKLPYQAGLLTRCFIRIMAKQNILTRSKKLKAQAALQANRLMEAKELFEAVCRLDRLDAEARWALSIACRRLKLFADAEIWAREAAQLQPQSAEAQHALGAALQCQGRMVEAIAHYRAALRIRPNFAEGHYFLANIYKDVGDTAGAETHYKEAIALHPDYLEALSNLGALLLALNRSEEALLVLQQALKLDPNAPQTLCNYGAVLDKDGQSDRAREYFQRALDVAPDFVDALVMLASQEEKLHHLENAKRLTERGLALAPTSVTLNLVAARIARTEKRFEDAIAMLEIVRGQNPMVSIEAEVCLDLGKLYDRVGDAERAFACFTEGNRLRESFLPTDYDRGSYLRKLEEISVFLTERLATAPQVVDEQPAPIFLVGFPRSGTTLLEQILDSHPRLQALEEKPIVDAMKKLFLEMAGDNPDALTDLTEADIGKLRQAYWSEVERLVKRQPGTLFVDKMPLNLANAHLIWRVFPQAKFILAIRHPCDCSLSCFMQNFVLNEAMSVFHTLENAVDLYEKVMGLWLRCAATLPLDYHRVRYEDVVEDFEGQARQLLDFLGVGWDAAVLKYDEHAKKRVIKTPSYHQVTQPIYQHAKYRWKRYAKQFEPVMATLDPFIEYFGYGEKQG